MSLKIGNTANSIDNASARDMLDASLATLRLFPTARTIINKVINSNIEFTIFVKESAGVFGAESKELGSNGPCIVWNPFGSFKTYASKIIGKREWNNSDIWDKKQVVRYPALVVLIHELGHAVQYIEDSKRFSTSQEEGTMSTEQIEADNLKRHENPVCIEMGLLQRVKYNDFV
jgi:hypothetical protein